MGRKAYWRETTFAEGAINGLITGLMAHAVFSVSMVTLRLV
jgi:hypothetical protein